jgi:hypothetical protein
MNVEEALGDLATAQNILPRASMQWALDHWDQAGPPFLGLLERYVDWTARSNRIERMLFFVLHLMAGAREARAFPTICRLFQDAGATKRILGDATTESLIGILISTFDGNQGALKGVIEDAKADEYVRHGALMTLAYFARQGEIPQGEMRAYLQRLHSEMQPQGSCYVWEGWTSSVALLGYQDLAESAEQLIERKFVPPQVTTVAYFRDDLRRALEDPESKELLELERMIPLTDPVGTLSTWYCFSEQYAIDEARREALLKEHADDPVVLDDGQPYVNPMRDVGRNDPCPCGSGKKYKQCCLQ